VARYCDFGNGTKGFIKCGEFCYWESVRFSRKTLLHGVSYLSVVAFFAVTVWEVGVQALGPP